MTELLITLMNAPRAVQRSVALGILAVVIAIIAGTIAFLATTLSGKLDNIQEMRTELFRLDQIIARKPSDFRTPRASSESSVLFVDGDSLPAIQARLQERVNVTARASGTVIASISGTSPVQLDGATYVGVRADMEGSLKSFHEVVRQLETSSPPLIIRQASIRSTNMISKGKLAGPLQLAGQIVVYGAVDPAVNLAENGRP